MNLCEVSQCPEQEIGMLALKGHNQEQIKDLLLMKLMVADKQGPHSPKWPSSGT